MHAGTRMHRYRRHVRTTIDLRDEQHRALTVLAARRGLKGFSVLIQEAIDAYVDDLDDEETDALLALEGVLDEAAGEEVSRRIAEVRGSWRTAS